jgi:hypothetical protein
MTTEAEAGVITLLIGGGCEARNADNLEKLAKERQGISPSTPTKKHSLANPLILA